MMNESKSSASRYVPYSHRHENGDMNPEKGFIVAMIGVLIVWGSVVLMYVGGLALFMYLFIKILQRTGLI